MRPEASVIVPEMMMGRSMPDLVERVAHGVDRRLGVQRVEDGFDQERVRAARDEAARRIAVGRHELIEGDRAKARIVDVRRNRGRAAGRAERAGHETRRAASRCATLVRDAPRELRRFAVELGDQLLRVP